MGADAVPTRLPFADSSGWKEFYEAMRKFGCGEPSEARYLASAGTSNWKQCHAHYAVGQFRLAGGDRAGAREHFSKAVNTRATWFIQWPWSLMFLSRLEKDPAWPKWIPSKKDQPKQEPDSSHGAQPEILRACVVSATSKFS